MLTSSPNAVVQKRDLHVGGLGSSAVGALAAVTDPAIDSARSWLRTADVASRQMNDFVRRSPWSAIAVVAVLGLAAGYVLSRRGQP